MKQFIGKWKLFLRWWLLFTLVLVAFTIFTSGGLLAVVYVADFTKLSFLIGSIMFGFLIRGGVLSYKLSKKEFISEEEFKEFYGKNDMGWFVSEKLLTLGLIGTGIGFIFMLGVFAGLAAVTSVAAQAAIGKMAAGASVALYTTVAGLVCGLILQIHQYDFSQYLDRFNNSCRARDLDKPNSSCRHRGCGDDNL